ncbi:hypothetical protein B0H16DRAFT_1894809 [Mycena metata]|uniref:F-box domain-containing protein n=1 Tax=Mycena metata TaxID=1033252 RepID=A0AAD7MP50_9AGAR|nr:hypothetical protein B0H16DRAFT_1894809 [Mycena metata]
MLPANIDLRAQLAAVDASIAQLKLRLKALEDVRSPIQRQLDSIVYPVLSLPPEITSKIFLHCLPPPPVSSSRKNIGPRTTLAPLLLLRICRVWREIALSTPHLWNVLHIDTTAIGTRIWSTTVVPDWFGRAGSCPLTFSLKNKRPIAHRLSAILSPLTSRLQNLYLDVPDQLEKFAETGPFPILETLAICHPRPSELDAPLKSFPTAPRLHHILFVAAKIPSLWIIPPSVRKVSCDAMSVNGCIDLLQRAPFLEELSCYVHFDSPRTEIITHNHLETLHLSGRLTGFIRIFRLPALHNLYLSDFEPEGNLDHFPSFLASTSVRRFHAAQEISSLAVEWFTTSMPGLVDLELFNPELQFFREFFETLDRAKEPGFLPHLRTLVFRECVFELDASMLQALSSRSTADSDTAILESFQQIWPLYPGVRKFYGLPPLDDSVITACRELVKLGMSVHVGPVDKNWV